MLYSTDIMLDSVQFFAYFHSMKRRDILKALKDAGFTLKEGGNHTLVYGKDGKRVSSVGRHTEIRENIVREIEKQTGVKLK